MKKKGYENNAYNVEFLYDTQTGQIVRNNGLWIQDLRYSKIPKPFETYEVFDIWSLGFNFAIIAVTNYSNYIRNHNFAKKITEENTSVDLIYYTPPTSTIFELDLLSILKQGITFTFLGENPPITGYTSFSKSYVLDEFKPADNDYIGDSTKSLNLSLESQYNENDYDNNIVYSPLYPRIYERDSNSPIKNRIMSYGAPIFYENGSSTLDPIRYRDLGVCDYFAGDWTAEHIGMGNLITNLYYSLIGESLKGISTGGSTFWGPLAYCKNPTNLGGSPLYSNNFNACGIEYIGNKYHFDDCSSTQFVGSDFSYYNYQNSNRMIQFRWNFWNIGTSPIYYPKPGTEPLKALDKASETRNFPDFPRQLDYNIPGTWIPATVNGTIGFNSYPSFYINCDNLSFSNGSQVQKLKIFAARDCTIALKLENQILINNYAPDSIKGFTNETFFFWSSTGPFVMTAGEIREISISIAPIIKFPSVTLRSNRYKSYYILGVGDLEEGYGQISYLELTYSPEYKINTFRLQKCQTNVLHERKIYAEDLNYTIEDRIAALFFSAKGIASTDTVEISCDVDKTVGDITVDFLNSAPIYDYEENDFVIQFKPYLNNEQFGYLVLKVNLSVNGQTKSKKYGFQVLPQKTLISQDFIQLSSLFRLNENDHYLYFERSLNHILENIPIRSFGNYIEILFEEGYEQFFDVLFTNNTIQGGTVVNAATTSFLELRMKPGLNDKDFFVRGFLFNKKFVDASGVEKGTNIKVPFYVSHFYPFSNNFKPLYFS